MVILFAACKPHTLTSSDKPVTTAVIKDARLKELSGIAASTLHPSVLYVHNDSGDSSRFFAIDTGGRLIAVCYFKGDPKLKPLGVRDCEDMCLSKGPGGGSYVYVGDIGDNDAVRKSITIYRMHEPAVGETSTDGTSAAAVQHLDSDPLYLRYPDGAHDAETLMADTIDKLLYVVTKREDSVSVYTTPLLYKSGDNVTLTFRTRLFFKGTGQEKWITAGDISIGGDQVLLKSYTKVYYWHRNKGEAVWQTLQRGPRELPYIIEPQGEAICFGVPGAGYYTVSEGVNPTLYNYVPKLD